MRDLIYLGLIAIIILLFVSFCMGEEHNGRLLVLEDSIAVLEQKNESLEAAVSHIDSVAAFRIDSLNEVAERNERARAAARARAGELEQQLRTMIPDTAHAVLDSLMQQIEVERQRYQVDSIAAKMRRDLLHIRIAKRDDRIEGLEQRLEAEIERSNYWKREADPSFFEEVQIGAKYVAIGVGAALIIEGLAGG